MQAGDIVQNDGTGGESIYGGTGEFYDEAFVHTHCRPGVLAMANNGPNSNSSQFYITTATCPWLDRDHVVFGHVIEGNMVTLYCNNLKRSLCSVLWRAVL